MGPRLLRTRALSASVISLLVFQATFALPVVQAADPTASQTPPPSLLPAPSAEPSSPPPQLASPAPTTTPYVSPTPQPSATPTPVDPATGLKSGATEIIAKRTESSQTYDNHDGTYSTVLSSGPEFYQAAGSSDWQPITLGFAKGAKSDGLTGAVPVVTSAQAPAAVSLFDLTSKDFVTVTDRGRSIGFALPLDAAKATKPTLPVVDGVAADYLGIQPGVDLRILAQAMGSKAFLILRSMPTDPSYTFRVDAPGLTLAPQQDGSISLVNASGAAIASIPHPYALDSTDDSLSGGGHYTDQASVVVGKDTDGAPTITISLDPTWLKTATFPVYLDPSVQYLSTNNTFDAHTASAFPSANYHAYERPDSPYYYEMWLGTDPSGTSGTSYDFISWDPSSIAGVTVDSSSVSTHPYHQYYSAPTVERSWIGIPTASWTEAGITWSNQPSAGTNITFIDGVEGSTTASNPSSPLDAAVQGWIDGTTANRGIRIWENGNGSTYWKRLIASEDSTNTSWRPTLTINYHIPVTTVYPTGGGPTSDTTLTWAADGSWASGSHYQVDVATNSGFAPVLWSSGDVTSSAKSVAIGTSLTPGTTYYWRVKVRDASGIWTEESATASFVYDLGNLGIQNQFGVESFDLGGGDEATVNATTGNLLLTHPIVTLPIRGSSLSLSLTYNSQDPGSVGIGPGWRLNVQRRLTLNADGTVTFIDADDARYTFTSPVTVGTVTTYTRPVALFATLKKDTSQTIEFTLTYRDQSRDTFDIVGSEGLLARAEDRHGNGVTVAYVSGTNRIDTLTDTAGGRTINFAYDGSLRVSAITDWAYLDGSGVVQATATGTRRSTRFFYDAGGNLAGWADPLNTSGTCPTGGSHLTCIAYGATIVINKTQTVETLGSTSLTGSPRAATTQIGMVGAETISFKDAEQVAISGTPTTFTRSPSEMVVLRPGTPSSTTTYGFVSSTDQYARIQSIWRLIGATNLEHRIVYDTGYPTLASIATDNYGALLSTPARTISLTYVPSSLGLVARTVEPLTTSPTTDRQTDNTYNANNDLVQSIVSQDGSGTLTTTSRYCYDASCSLAAAGLDLLGEIDNYVSGGAQNSDTNFTTNYGYDSYGQRLSETRHNRDASGGTRDDRVTAFSYDSYGDMTSQVVNYVNGFHSGDPYDIAPDPSSGARTDLTTTYSYDTGGNQVSTTDPRKLTSGASGADDFVSRTTHDALNEIVTQTLPTTPASLGGVACSPDPACRRTATSYDEFGGSRESIAYSNLSGVALVDGTEFDHDGRPTRTFEDTDGAGTGAPAVTSKTVYDASGRPVDVFDRVQVTNSAAGYTLNAYDALGRSTDVTAAYSSTPNVASVTHTVYDALNQATQSVVGYAGADPQTTTTTFDIGGRDLTVDDGYSCQGNSFDYLDHVVTETDGLDTSCAAVSGQTVVLTDSIDGLGRTYRQEITSGPNTADRPEDDTFDSIGNTLTSASRIAGVVSSTTFTINLLDQTLSQARPDGTTAKNNFDPVGNPIDACTWNSGVIVGACLAVGTSPWPNPPSQATSTSYDAINHRIGLVDSTSSLTTTYNPAADYQTASSYLPSGSGKELQTIYGYDARNRLASVTNQVCVISTGHSCSSTTPMGSDSYSYDDNNNQTQVSESNGSTSSNRYFCYDAQNRLIYRNTGSMCSSSAKDESDTFDATGNRTQLVSGGITTNFAYSSSGQLCKVGATVCSSPNVTYDSAGRIATYNGWAFAYDSQDRVVSACQSLTCTGSGFSRVDYTYDAQGHRTSILETTSGGLATTTSLHYVGDAISSETVSNGISRSFVTDSSGRILKVIISGDTNANDNATFVVMWSGHGDALGLWRQNSDGTTTVANSYTYGSWGSPTTTIATTFGDLGFRYLYVGASGVESDGSFGLGLLYMGAREYAPALGRFLQPDPARSGGSSYTYASDNPVALIDPSGTCAMVATNPGAVFVSGAGCVIEIGSETVAGATAGTLGFLVAFSTLFEGDTAQTDTQPRRLAKPVPLPTPERTCWVIGESQTRVNVFARKYWCDTMWDLPSSLPRQLKLYMNMWWVLIEMSTRKHLFDMGKIGNNSPYYRLEHIMTVVYTPKTNVPPNWYDNERAN